ncbi:hypothetical protein KGM_216196A, partial [Danaus plexippus plexippus]
MPLDVLRIKELTAIGCRQIGLDELASARTFKWSFELKVKRAPTPTQYTCSCSASDFIHVLSAIRFGVGSQVGGSIKHKVLNGRSNQAFESSRRTSEKHLCQDWNSSRVTCHLKENIDGTRSSPTLSLEDNALRLLRRYQ